MLNELKTQESENPFVNFIIIGAQKSGTTALSSFLAQHPEICMAHKPYEHASLQHPDIVKAQEKEVHLFDAQNFNANNSVSDINAIYKPSFSQYKHQAIIGEATPIYSYLPKLAKHLHHYNPDLKLVMIIRPPIERAISHYKMEHKRGLEKLSLNMAFLTEPFRLFGLKNKTLVDNQYITAPLRVASYLDRGLYIEQIKNYQKYFSNEQFLIITNDELKKNHSLTLKRIYKFLKLKDQSFIPATQKVFSSTDKNPELNVIIKKYLGWKFRKENKLIKKLELESSQFKTATSSKKRVLFYRDFTEYFGGHQKVFDYFNHLLLHPDFIVDIAFSKETLWDKSNPWFPEYQTKQVPYQPKNYDYLFIAGLDWNKLPKDINCPIINLIQHVRHADPDNQLYSFLSRKAARITVAKQVKSAIEDTGRVNGSVTHISMGHELPEINMEKQFDFYILGNKNPRYAQEIAQKLNHLGHKVLFNDKPIEREKVFKNLSSSKIGILLPNRTEGFYLPALESMKYCDLTIVPDCVGNSSFCLDQKNCFMPEFNIKAIVNAAINAHALLLNSKQLANIKMNAKETVLKHSLLNERQNFYQFLKTL